MSLTDQIHHTTLPLPKFLHIEKVHFLDEVRELPIDVQPGYFPLQNRSLSQLGLLYIIMFVSAGALFCLKAYPLLIAGLFCLMMVHTKL